MATRRTRRYARGLLATMAAAALTAGVSAVAPAAGAATAASYSATFRADVQAVAAAGGIGVVAAATGPKVTWSGAAGVRSIDAAVPAQPGDTTRIGSVTKSMVSVLALQEVQAHRWTLGTTVGSVLPGLIPGHEDVTLAELLSHRSGMPDFVGPIVTGVATGPQLLERTSGTYTKGQLVRIALTQPWLFTPGSAFSYSNSNYIVIGLMLEKANGTPVSTLLRQRVFGPAHMASATLQTTGPWPTARHLTDYAVFERPYNVDGISGTLLSTAGAVQASSQDVDRFYRALFTGKLLPPWLVRQMATPRTLTPLAYGLGIYAVGDPCPGPNGEQQALYGHDGATFGTETLAFTSADGLRQASISWTGRQLTTTSAPTGPLANQFLYDAFSANCPRAVPTSARAGKGVLPSLRSFVPADRSTLP